MCSSDLPRVAEAAVERARLSVVPRARVQAARVPFVTLVSLLLLGGVVGLLFFNTSMQQSSFTVSRLQDQADALSARQQSLSMELQTLQDPQNIARRAQRLGMVIPAAPLFLDLADGKVLGDTAVGGEHTKVVLHPPVPTLPAELNPRPEVKVVPPPEGVLPDDATTGTSDQNSKNSKNDRLDKNKQKNGTGQGRGAGRSAR